MSVQELPAALTLLRDGDIELEGRMVDASNATLFGTVTLDGVSSSCVYKPRRGERPLWDFPDGTLAHREAAAYLVSEATGWGIVPPTVLREGPVGPGMCQLWIDVDEDAGLIDVVPAGEVPDGWRRVLDAQGMRGEAVTLAHADDVTLRRMAVLDAVTNNADRKGGHVLPSQAGPVYGIDHGLCFNEEEKLRTVLWGWAGEPVDPSDLDVLCALQEDLLGAGPLFQGLSVLLSRAEVKATVRRVRRLTSAATYPLPRGGGPAIPWPPF